MPLSSVAPLSSADKIPLPVSSTVRRVFSKGSMVYTCSRVISPLGRSARIP
jgi:hypothetical protein